MQAHPKVFFQSESKFHTFTEIQGHLKDHITTLHVCQIYRLLEDLIKSHFDNIPDVEIQF